MNVNTSRHLGENEVGCSLVPSTVFANPVFVLSFQGFSVEGQENLQEILSKQLLLCQFLMALSVVRTGDVSSAVSPPQDPLEALLDKSMTGVPWKVKKKICLDQVTGG